MNIGIYGGTFNPPHLGHFQACREAVPALGLDRLLLIPAADPPHKQLPPDSPALSHRLAMAGQMADALGQPGVAEVSRLEAERQGPSYTSQTLEEVARAFPGARLQLLMGTDMFLTLHQWHRPQEIFRLAEICVFGRSRKDDEGRFAPQKAYLEEEYNARIQVLTLEHVVDISSTRLRCLLKDGQGQEFLLPSVYGYILRNRLYGTRTDLRHLSDLDLRACSLSMVRAKRVAHILGVEEECVRLARRWGADESHARRAGILHDCTKYHSIEEHLAICDAYDFALDELERKTEKLLHAKSGACIARHVFGEPEEVVDAILWHTTAAPHMTLLAKILYVADYMEPNRDFPGVERLRALAYSDLDGALLLGVETSIRELRQRGKEIHSMTREAENQLRAQGVEVEEV